MSSLLEPDAPVARWYDRLLPCSGTLRQLTRRWGEAAAVLTVVGAFRSLSQVIFINNPLSGVLLLLALLVQSPSIALFATVGIVAANLAAKALGAPWADRHNGIYGFNGALVGSAIGAYADLGPPRTALLWALLAVGGAAITAVLVHGLGRRFHAATGLPPLTLPFCLVTWGLLMLVTLADLPALQLQSPALPPPAESVIQAFLLALPRGFGQVFFCGDLASSWLVLAATAVASPVAAGVGLMGGAIGALTGLASGATAAVAMGLWSFEGVLSAIAIAGIFHAPTRRCVGVAALAALVASLLSPLLERLMPFGLPGLTLSFIVATLGTLLVVRRTLPTVVPVALHAILTPEEHLQRYLVTRQLLNDFRSRLGWTLDGGGRTSLVPSADPALLMRLAALFERLDSDQDGQLSLAELAEGMGQGRSDPAPALARVLAAMDLDGDGAVDKPEFFEVMLRLRRLRDGQERLRRYLIPVDADGDERLDPSEMDRLLRSIGQPSLNHREQRAVFGPGMAGLSWQAFFDRLLLT
ncbi:urea transporter [Cyanobium gracile UHCC 0281]|uniref:Urea transporter n=1 Tax=Cyanobium gracile UHCC 0281 TaxID=3110309 RepID=A0ABU5SXN8_9CYAN|nr:urea transporter [Cyanobium gracile UHCC 0281]